VRRWAVITFAVAALFAAAACDDDTEDAVDDAQSAVDDIQEKAGEAGARGIAEAYRASLKAEDIGDDESLCDVEALQSASEDLPGDPDIQIDDRDDDGADDDCYVQVNVNDQSACVTVPKSGDNVDVSGGACPDR
jgi:hypothetical protein